MRRSKKLRRTAYHEAAHAVVLYRTAGHVGGHVTIIPKPIEGGLALGAAFDGLSDSLNLEHMEATLLSLYAGGHAQRQLDPSCGEEGCGGDEEQADRLLRLHGWECREQELRDRSLTLTRQHWTEIVAVADELLRIKLIDDAEVELICDEVAGDDPDAIGGLGRYRKLRDWEPRAGST